MKTSVELRGPFSYALWPVVVLFFIVALFVIYYIMLFAIKIMNERKEKNEKGNVLVQKNRFAIKNKYMAEIDKIENLLMNNKIEIRVAYINLSELIRGFVYEMTDLDVRCYTLQDIRNARVPLLDQLISEFYYPEFAELSVADVQASIMRTRRVIEIWR